MSINNIQRMSQDEGTLSVCVCACVGISSCSYGQEKQTEALCHQGISLWEALYKTD